MNNKQYTPVGDQPGCETELDFEGAGTKKHANTPLRSLILRHLRISKRLSRQITAAALLLLFGFLPFVLTGYLTTGCFVSYGICSGRWFYGVFSSKTIGCGDAFQAPQNSTVSGIEALFVLDHTFGRYSFSQVKMIDVTWDVGLGRTVQVAVWCISYLVFTDALLRTIERHPTSFETFSRICLEGPSLMSLWSLLKDLFRAKSKRTKLLFLYMVLGVAYVLSLPTILGAMTGYVSTSIAWVDPAGNNQMIPASQFMKGYMELALEDTAYDYYNFWYYQYHNTTCFVPADGRDLSMIRNTGARVCDCKLPNGSLFVPLEYNSRFPIDPSCQYNYTGQTGTYTERISDDPYVTIERNCSGYEWVKTIDGKEVEVDFNKYSYTEVQCNPQAGLGFVTPNIPGEKIRCLPDTTNESFQWGFSSMLSGVFIITHFIWSVTMYVVWQDAQFNSKLVKTGYRMTLLRAAFAICTAASWRTGLENRELVKTSTKALDTHLYGRKREWWKRREDFAQVDVEIFADVARDKEVEDGYELRRRQTRSTVREEVVGNGRKRGTS